MTKYKWLIILSLFCYILTGCTTSSDISKFEKVESEVQEYEQTSSDAEKPEMLYRTKSGECYHRAGCIYLKSQIPVSPDGAQSMGLRPCSRCNPGL